jgi:RHS repeat-associated protein
MIFSNTSMNDIVYYLYDHLGNMRLTYSVDFNTNSTMTIHPESAFDYDPYGVVLRQYTTGPEPYLTTQHQRDTETGLDYRGARFYDAEVGRFLSVDPLSVKYPTLTTYSFVAGMVTMAVDPDGKEIIINSVKILNPNTGNTEKFNVVFNGSSISMSNSKTGELLEYQTGMNEFVDGILTSYNYIATSGADVDNAMQKIAESKEISLKIREVNREATYYKGVIEYDFSYGLEVFGAEGQSLGIQSPALGFWSEVYHAYIDLVDSEARAKYKNDISAEEQYVHLEKESEVVDRLNEHHKTEREVKRQTYKMEGGDAALVKTKGVTSNERE